MEHPVIQRVECGHCNNLQKGHLSSKDVSSSGILGINNPLVPKTNTQETENLDKSIFSCSRGCKPVLTPAKQHTSTRWLTVAPPYIPDTVVPAPHLGFVQVKVHNLLRLVKRLRGWVRVYSWWAMELYRKQGPFKHASHLRW
jgi:hypothetical protein